MSKYIIDEQTCIDVSDAIRAKTKKSGTMSAADWATKINSISGGLEPFYQTEFTLSSTSSYTNETNVLTKSAIGTAVRNYYKTTSANMYQNGRRNVMLARFEYVGGHGTTYEFVECLNVITFNWYYISGNTQPTTTDLVITSNPNLCYSTTKGYYPRTFLKLSDPMAGVISAYTGDTSYKISSGKYGLSLYDLSGVYSYAYKGGQ